MAKKDKKTKKKAGDWSDEDTSPTKPAGAPTLVKDAVDDDEEEEEEVQPKSASKFSFANLGDDDGGINNDQASDDEGNDLMAAARASEKRRKEKKGKKTPAVTNGEPLEDATDSIDYASKAPVEMTADQLMEEEFGPTKVKLKGKKGKKGKLQQMVNDDEDEPLSGPAAQQTAIADAQAAIVNGNLAVTPDTPVKLQGHMLDEEDDAGEAQEEGANKVLSKKEKERIKKEKDKAKKKAQAAAKKTATSGGNAPEDESSLSQASPGQQIVSIDIPATVEIDDGEEAEDGEGGGSGAASKNKKKKKKGPAQKAEEPTLSATKAASAKKVPAHIAAMRAALEKQKAAEAEARQREEDERRRIEEEEARQAELERMKEEEKKRKKEKEKAKIDNLKKEGKYLTPKQKQEAATAKARKDAMIASGQIKVEGLTDADVDEASKPKKVSYGKKKPQKKEAQPNTMLSNDTSPSPTTPTAEEPSISEDPTRIEEHEPADNIISSNGIPEEDAGKSDWDASTDDEKAENVAKDTLGDWDTQSKPDLPTSAASLRSQEMAAKLPAAPLKAPFAPALAKTALSANTRPNGGSPKNSSAKADPVVKAAPSLIAGTAAQNKNGVKHDDQVSESEDDEEEDEDEEDELSSNDSDSESDSDSEHISATRKKEAIRKAEATARREQKRKEAIAAGSADNLRSPICCILGHVDTGKTKILDKIRQTNVQEGEAGGITQQIGATYFPMDSIIQKTEVLGKENLADYRLPGLLVIDTPGHESFTNLRTRGSSLCNIAILVVDIMHGLEPQTLESLRLLRTRETPFIVALNKIDRLYGWQATPDGAFRESLAKQGRSVQNEFEKRLKETMLAFAEQGLNAVPYYDNKNFAKNVSLVPTSAHTGEGIPDMLMLIIKLTQERMSSQLMYISELECTVLEVKVIEGLGTTLDVVLSNGVMREGDKIVVCGLNGPIVSQVRALLTPQPLKELRIKGQYVHHQEIKASLGVKIVAPELEKAIAGSRLLVCGPDDDEDDLKDEVMEDLQTIMKSVDRSGRGVYVQASTLGSLEALLEFLRVSKIPVSGINIGPVHKKDITRCAVMLDRAPEFAVLLAFDVEIDKEAAKMAEDLHIKVFKADIIYHLFDAFTKHNAEVLEAKRKDSAPNAIWPCKLKILKCFAKRDPIIVGCDIVEGSTVRVGTPICVVKIDPETKKKDIIRLGKITSLEINHKTQEIVKKSQVGAGVAVKIEHAVYESARLFGRHFDEKDELVAMLSRESIDTLKQLFKKDVSNDDWLLIRNLKPLLNIP